MEMILRDEWFILIPRPGLPSYAIERSRVRTDADIQPILGELQQQPWVTDETCRRVEGLLKEWLDATYRRGRYAPDPQRDAAAAAMLDPLRPFLWGADFAAKFAYPHMALMLQEMPHDGSVGNGTSLCVLHWLAMTRLAAHYGWQPEHPLDYYWPPRRQIISKEDARALGVALRRVLVDVPDELTQDADTRAGLLECRVPAMLQYLSMCKWATAHHCETLELRGPFALT